MRASLCKRLIALIPFVGPRCATAFRAAKNQIRFHRDFKHYRRLCATAKDTRGYPVWADRLPVLDEWTATTGFDRHYVYHTSWAARVLAETRPEFHIDISSSLFFCGIVSAFLPVRFYDYRPAELQLTSLTSQSADLMKLPFADASVRSLSCMHVVEHVGLGRYGDALDPQGDSKAIAELQRVIAPAGNLLFVVPIGAPVTRFNAHRIYSYDQVVASFPKLKLRQFALIPENETRGGLIIDAPKQAADAESYGCGCFWFVNESGQ